MSDLQIFQQRLVGTDIDTLIHDARVDSDARIQGLGKT